MMTAQILNSTVGDLVVEHPARARVFERFGIDYCCGGKKPLAEACLKKGLDPLQIINAFEANESAQNSPDADPAAMTLTELADHIEQTHHAWLKFELPRLRQLVEKVARVHGDNHAWMNELRDVYQGLEAEMQSHMGKEEQVLFPLIRQIEAGASLPTIQIGIEAPVNCMEHEHESAGQAVQKMRELSNGFTPPQGACNTFRVMLDSLAGLEADLHNHVHKENNILFPRAIELSHRKRAEGVA